MLEIEIKLSIAFHSQTDRQMERTNQELEQYLRIYINHRQSKWLEWLTTAKFTFNNKIYTAIKLSPFKVNYEREPRIGFEIRKKEKYAKTKEFVKKMKTTHKKTKAVLKKSQKEMKKYTDRNKKEMVEYKVGDKVLYKGFNITDKEQEDKKVDREICRAL